MSKRCAAALLLLTLCACARPPAASAPASAPALADRVRSALRALALHNLRKAGSALAPEAVEQPAGVYMLATGDSYDAARLLLPELWAPLAKQVDGRLVVVAPTRDVVFATGSKNAAGLAGLRRVAEGLVGTEAYPLSTQLLQWSPSGWTAFKAR